MSRKEEPSGWYNYPLFCIQQVVWFGKDSWFNVSAKSTQVVKTVIGDGHHPPIECHDKDESTHLLTDAVCSSMHKDPLMDNCTQTTFRDKTSTLSTDTPSQANTRTFRYWCVTSIRCISLVYIVLGLITFAMGLFWRTGSYVSLLGPLACFCIVLVVSEYYHAKRSKRFEQCEMKYGQPVE